MIDVVVEIDRSKASFFVAKDFLASQEIVEVRKNGNIIVSFKVTQEMEVEDLIKQWIPYIKVLEPISLDEKIKNDLRKYLVM
jgi:predicted DNA-binding transcriptional regulator YafY